MISIQSDREWQHFCDLVLNEPELGKDSRFADNTHRVKNRNEMDKAINSTFSVHDIDELISILDQAKIANSRLSSVSDLSHNELIRNVVADFDGTEVSMADLPVETDADRPRVVPTLDQHGPAIRSEFSPEH